MSSLSISKHHALPRFSARGLLDLVASVDARYRSRMALKAMDDRMVRDMGITRADVDSELRRGSIW